jgi:hypothetical protein
MEPVNNVNGLGLICPALIGIDIQRQVADFPDGIDHFLVIVPAELYFQDLKTQCHRIGYLFPDHLGAVYADRIRCERHLCGIGPVNFVAGLAQQLSTDVI